MTFEEKCKEMSIKYKKHRARQRRLETKMEAFKMYGGPKCACCGETCFLFLVIDHILNDGSDHRKEMKAQGYGPSGIYRWLRDNDYPSGFQVLCASCNLGKQLNDGVCPHHGYANHVKMPKVKIKGVAYNPKVNSWRPRPKVDEEIKRMQDFIVEKISTSMTLYEILDTGLPERFYPWNRNKLREALFPLIRIGKVDVIIQATGRRPAKYISSAFNTSISEDDGVDFE